ncbi:class I SAM-dependent methyltransferase [bacterium]|nr:class I SAM-dependent methyltransferase [bacterium]MCB9475435.1 class I SAM-dependent methyltransferase [Deltaproteobacteria bacterium]MCB9478512.1 class I SAM-dependent methyltransferase [Deltaproteobacteria bacterium]
MNENRFAEYYRESTPPWEVGHVQPIVVDLVERGELKGEVLDIGCGTGENTLYIASKGIDVVGLDFTGEAIERAREKAAERGIDVEFIEEDALTFHHLRHQFDTVLDSALFHVFNDEQRLVYDHALHVLLRPGGMYHMICFSDAETREGGPRRVKEEEIRETFALGWEIHSIEPDRYTTHLHEGGSRVWRCKIERV